MPIAIVLRTAKTKSLYRDAIINTINSGAGNYALICSGFFQENFKGSRYQASMEPGLVAAITKNSVQLDTLGVHNSAWKNSYINFCNNLRRTGASIVPYVMKGYQWHAKVFILKQKSAHVFGIIGSSNITANAFGVSNVPSLPTDSPYPPRNFNFECDAYFWNDENKPISAVMKLLLDQDDVRRQVIITQYNPQDNIGLNIEDRLSEVEQQIWSNSKIELLQ